MNNQFPSAEVGGFSTRTLVNFPFLTSDSLASLIDGLNFKMGLSELRFCQNFFRNERLNNPTIHELKIIDRVYYDHSRDPKTKLVAAFLTNDQTVADTYADLMARRRAVDPEYSAPCSVVDMLNILPEFLGRDSAETAAKLTLFGGKLRGIDAAVSGHRKIAEVGKGITAISLRKPHPKDRLEVGDVVYAVLKSFNDCEDFESRLEELAQSQEMISLYKKAVVINDQSIVGGLSRFELGTALNSKPFEGKDGCISPFEPLAEGDFGVLAVFNKTQASDMLVKAQELGLRVVTIGQLTKDKKISGASLAGETLTIDIKLLNSIAFSHPRRCEADGEKPQIEEESGSVYINLSGKRYRMNSAICGGDNYFMAGFNSVLHSYALCAASGATEVLGAGVYTLPLSDPDEKELGSSVELILGAYRAQCELGIVDVCPKIEIGDTPSLCFHTLAESPLGTPMKTSAQNTRVFYVEPARKESGLPDFKNLNALFDYVKKSAGDGKLSAVYPTCENLDADLEKMLEGAHEIQKNDFDAATAHHGGFLLATTANSLDQGAEVAYIPRETGEAQSESFDFEITTA